MDQDRAGRTGHDELGQLSLLATFTRRAEAEWAATSVRGEMPSAEVVVGDREDVLDALAVNQRAELDDAAMAPSVGLWPGPMIRGALVWGLVGLVVGAFLALPLLALVEWPESDRGLFVVSVAAIGALATSTVTFLVGAVQRAQQEGEFTPEDPWAVVTVRDVDPRQEAPVTELLVSAGARSIRRLDGPVARVATDDAETPRRSVTQPGPDDWPASQPGARSL